MFQFFKRTPIEELDRFRLENLLNNRVPFLFIFLTDSQGEVGENLKTDVKKLLNQSKPMTPVDLLTQVKSDHINENQPIVLVCRDGNLSKEVARKILKISRLNVFIIEGGYLGLERTD